MAEVISNLGEIISSNISIADVLPVEVADSLGSLIWIFKAVGVVVFIYVIFLIVKSILGIRRNLMIKKTYKIVKEIDEKLNKVLDRKGHKYEKEEHKHGKEEHKVVKEKKVEKDNEKEEDKKRKKEDESKKEKIKEK